jgi:sporulation protein YlmC with PRC-barrel domain
VKRFSAEQLLRLPVRVRGIDVGHVVDLLLDPDFRRVIGVEVLCKNDERRFLPLSAATISEGEIAVSSALAMLAADELAFYRERGGTIRLLRGTAVVRGRKEVGRLEDVVVTPEGIIEELAVADGATTRRLPAQDGLRIIGERRLAS